MSWAGILKRRDISLFESQQLVTQLA